MLQHVTFIDGPLDGLQTRISGPGSRFGMLAPTTFWVRKADLGSDGSGPLIEADDIAWRTGETIRPDGPNWYPYRVLSGGDGKTADSSKRCVLIPIADLPRDEIRTITPTERLKSKKARQITVGIFLDESPADRLDAAVLNRQQARQMHAPADDLALLDEAVKTAQQALDDVTFWFTFRAVGRKAFSRLLDEHPPTDGDIADAESRGLDRPGFHAATFTPALLAASCVTPVLSLDAANSLLEDDAWGDQELGSLIAAALAVNTTARPLRVQVPPDPRSGSDLQPVT